MPAMANSVFLKRGFLTLYFGKATRTNFRLPSFDDLPLPAGKEKFICAYDERMLVDGNVREVCAEILVNRIVKDPEKLSSMLS